MELGLKSMPRKTFYPILLVTITLLFLLSLSSRQIEMIKEKLSSLNLSQMWELKKQKNPELEKAQTELLYLQNQVALLEKALAQQDLKAIEPKNPLFPAKVVFRSPQFWNTTLWINAGLETHPETIAKNSPVVLGKAVVGIVEYVGKSQSRVRLITDPQITVAVRANKSIGEIQGSLFTSWRRREQRLQGSGFCQEAGEGGSTVQQGDLLITTGMDGLFPPGFIVGQVTHVNPLKEGDSDYTLEAESAIKNFEDLSLVFVMPPWGYDPESP